MKKKGLSCDKRGGGGREASSHKKMPVTGDSMQISWRYTAERKKKKKKSLLKKEKEDD